MRKTEFLEELQEALAGEVPTGVIQENVMYYNNYISQETAKGRSEDEIIEELGGPRIIARTIIDSSEAAAEAGGSSGAYYSDAGTHGEDRNPQMNRGMGKGNTGTGGGTGKFLIILVILFVIFIVLTLVGGIFSLLFRFAGPLIIIWLIVSLFKGLRR